MPKLPELASIPMRGVDHLAFVTDDLPATMDFYTRVLGMQLVHVRRVPFEQDRGQPPYDNLRHYFFNMGNDTLLAFFEYPKGLAKQNRDLPGGMQHIMFHAAPDRFDAIVSRVRDCGVNVIGPAGPRRPVLVGLFLRSERHPPGNRDQPPRGKDYRRRVRAPDRAGSPRRARNAVFRPREVENGWQQMPQGRRDGRRIIRP